MSKEMWVLAEHHKAILENQFPSYVCKIYGPNRWVRIEVISGNGVGIICRPGSVVLLVASFSSNCVRVATPPFKDTGVLPMILSTTDFNFTEEMSYADPKFTDNILIDVLERLGR